MKNTKVRLIKCFFMYKNIMEQKNSYGIPYVKLENLNDIQVGKFHYNYKTIDFMLNYKENSEKLLIIFHGSIRINDKLPMFLKHNYNKENISVLSISDKLLEFSQNRTTKYTRSAYFAETTEYKFHKTYCEIIEKSINITNNKKNIFIGPCIGAKPAVYFGSKFKSQILLMNGWLYPTEEMKTNFETIAKIPQNSIINYNIEQKILESQPEFIHIYINKQDKMTFDMNLQFVIFCKKNTPDKFKLTVFDYYNPDKFDPHMTFFPEGENFDSVVAKI